MKKIIYIALCFILFACTNNKEDILVIGTSADNPPYEFIENDKIVGLDIDFAYLIGNKLNRKIEIKNIDFPNLIPALYSGDVDFVVAGLGYSNERAKSFDFSSQYITTNMAIISSLKINSESDLSGKTIGVQSGSTWEDKMNKIVDKMPNITVKSLSNNLLLIEDLKLGNIDAIVLEEAQADKFTQENFYKFILPDSEEGFRVLLPKNSDLTKSVNVIIEEEKDNIEKLKNKWLSGEK